MADIQHPQPSASWESRGYWEGAGRNELVLQFCSNCGAWQHKPRALCVSCGATAPEHRIASGRGTVYSYTVTNQNQARGFADACPYVMAYVDTDEGPRLLTNIVGCEPDQVHIGMAVEVDFVHGDRDDEEAFAVPVFRPAAG